MATTSSESKRERKMGVIKDGKVSGFIPTKEVFGVNYPAYPSNISRAIQTLGGIESIAKARTSQSNKLELHFRPEDPHSHPVSGELHPCNNLLLRISKKKQTEGSAEGEEVCADVVARVPETYQFEGMADYQHVVAVHAEDARRKKRNWTEMEEPHFDKAGLMDLDQEDVMILLPPLFSLKDIPENIALKPPSTLPKKKQDEVAEQQFEIREPALAIDFNIKEIPKEQNWRDYIFRGSELWHWQMAVSELFDEKPIWPKASLTARLLAKDLKFNHLMMKRLLLTVAYYFAGGPFQRFWIRKGYDPRKNPDSCMYQRLDFRVPPALRHYCDTNASKKLKHKWEDICKFHVFPYKCQTSLQLYELDDDYIQNEIRKPPKLTACTYGTGWFSQHVHDTFRHRVMVRFLSVYPENGAKKLLKATSDDFEKSKRASLLKDVLKPDQTDQHKEVMEDETNENRNSPDGGDVNDIEADDHDEELDADEAVDGKEDEISLQSHSTLERESNSRNYLQELFDSFPYMNDGGDKIQDAESSEEEYQIYEQDDDDLQYDDDVEDDDDE